MASYFESCQGQNTSIFQSSQPALQLTQFRIEWILCVIDGDEAAGARIDHLPQIMLNIGAPKGRKGETAGLKLPPKRN